jgi:hypothetical protein
MITNAKAHLLLAILLLGCMTVNAIVGMASLSLWPILLANAVINGFMLIYLVFLQRAFPETYPKSASAAATERD